MHSQEFNLNFLEFTNDKIAVIKGTDGDDSIDLECLTNSEACILNINGNKHNCQRDDLQIFDLEIKSAKGNDSINVTMPKGMIIKQIQIYPGEGTNNIYSKLFSPSSSATLNLDYGSNTISFEPGSSNIFIKGFKNSPDNRLQIRDTKLTLDDILIKRADTPPFETYSVYLKSPDNPANKYHLCYIYNTLTPQEYNAYAELKILEEDGVEIPSEYQSMSYVLCGPKDLASEILNSHNIIFSLE